ncbi:MAG: hypothetical protein LBC86_08825, partial [Oscillospiraceae bacterium]|nr:hypothetical protein [Oscillospiraceae bacterium]
MKNNKLLFAAAVLIALALYNALVFILAGEKTNVFWFAYGFTTAAFLTQLPIFLIVFKPKPEKEIIYSTPFTSISLFYLTVQLIAGVAIMLSGINLRISLALQIVILALFLIIITLTFIARNAIKNTAQNTADSTIFIKSTEQYIISLNSIAGSSDVKEKLLVLAEKIRFSDPVSHPLLADEERRISERVGMLAEQLSSGNGGEASGLFDEIGILIAERNRKCKMVKS